MKIILVVLLFVLGVFAALALGGGLLALLAYGVGWLLNRVMQVEPFQATALALGAMLAFGILAERMWRVIVNPPPFSSESEEFDDEYDDEYDDEDEDDEPPVYVNPSIPRWRQPLKQVDFSNVKPDDRCPCGSERKYKNCHGVKQTK